MLIAAIKLLSKWVFFLKIKKLLQDMVSVQQAMQNVDNTRYLLLRWKRKRFYFS